MKKTPAILLALLMACGSSGPIAIGTRPIEVTKSTDFNGLGLIGYQPLAMRAEFKRGDEIKGAHCELTGSGFSTTFLTPAIVMIPNFGARNQDLVTYCRYEGQTATQIQQSKKRTGISLSGIASGAAGIVGGALGGLVVGTVADAITKEPTSDYGYEDTTVVFEEKE